MHSSSPDSTQPGLAAAATSVPLPASLDAASLQAMLDQTPDWVMENATDAIIATDLQLIVRGWNRAAENTYGWQAAEVIGRRIVDVIDIRYENDDNATAYKTLLAQGSWKGEVYQSHRDGHMIPILSAVILVKDDQDHPIGIVGYNRDITERKRTEEKLRAALAEKETLLRELYHRTKNNMQVISSLLALQEDGMDDPTVKTALKEVRNRIQAMSLVHQKLYQSQSLSNLDLSDYVRDLAVLLLRSYDLTSRVDLVCEISPVWVRIDIAIPCGLILNELISNALKYAFPDGGAQDRPGVLRIWLHRDAQEQVCLGVADNGLGFPPGFNARKDGRLGLQTVFALAEMQLQGQVSFGPGPGASCEVRFSDAFYNTRV